MTFIINIYFDRKSHNKLKKNKTLFETEIYSIRIEGNSYRFNLKIYQGSLYQDHNKSIRLVY